MSTTPILKRIIVALNLPTVISLLIIKGRAIHKAMVASSYFESSVAKLASLEADLQVLEAAETGCNTTPPTSSVEARDVAKEQVIGILRSLRGDVQVAVDADPINGLAIIASAAMDAKRDSSRTPQQNIAKDGSEEGSVLLTSDGKGPHEWRISTNDREWTLLSSTLSAKNEVEGLIPGQVYYFQNRPILANGEVSEWTQSVKFRVR